jgi:hypothetical protein
MAVTESRFIPGCLIMDLRLRSCCGHAQLCSILPISSIGYVIAVRQPSIAVMHVMAADSDGDIKKRTAIRYPRSKVGVYLDHHVPSTCET